MTEVADVARVLLSCMTGRPSEKKEQVGPQFEFKDPEKIFPKAKLKILEIIHFISILRLDHRVSRILLHFKRSLSRRQSRLLLVSPPQEEEGEEKEKDDGPSDADRILDVVSEVFDNRVPNSKTPLDISQSKEAIYVAILLRQLTSSYQPLVSLALTLLFQHFRYPFGSVFFFSILFNLVSSFFFLPLSLLQPKGPSCQCLGRYPAADHRCRRCGVQQYQDPSGTIPQLDGKGRALALPAQCRGVSSIWRGEPNS